MALVVTVLAVAGSAAAAASVNVSRTFGLEPGDWVLVQVSGFQANGNITVAIDGVQVFQGKADANGALTASVQVPYTANDGYTKLTVTDNVNTVDTPIQIKGAMEGFIETTQSMAPLASLFSRVLMWLVPAILIILGIAWALGRR